MLSVKRIQLGCKTLSYAAVKNVPLLAPLVNRVTGGRVNKHSLAQDVWRAGIEVAKEYAIDAKVLGERSAKVVPLLLQALVDNDREQMASAIRQLTSDALDGYVSKDAPDVRGRFNACFHSMASALTQRLTVALLGDHAVEKILATAKAKHGAAPFEHFLQQNLGAFAGRDAVARQALHCLDDMLDDPAYVQTDSAVYSTLADLVHIALQAGSEAEYLDVLKAYAPRSFATVETVHRMAQAVGGERGARVVPAVIGSALDGAQRGLGALAWRTVDEAYRTRPPAPLASLAPTATERDIADALLHSMTHAAATTPGSNRLPGKSAHRAVLRERAALDDASAPERGARMDRVADALSPAQLFPLGRKRALRVAKTWTGHLAEVHSTNRWGPLRDDALHVDIVDRLDRAPTDFTQWDGRTVGRRFAATHGALNLTLGADGSRARDGAVLQRLFETCGRDAALMREATRYLDEALAQRALVEPVAMQLADARTGLMRVGGAWLDVAALAAPRYRFKVRRTDDAVHVDLQAKWPITAYGSAPDKLRLPFGAHRSYLAVRGGVTLRRPAHALPTDSASVLTEIDAKGVRAVVENVIAFDPRTGAMPEPPAEGFVWVPEHVERDELPFIGASRDWDMLPELGFDGHQGRG